MILTYNPLRLIGLHLTYTCLAPPAILGCAEIAIAENSITDANSVIIVNLRLRFTSLPSYVSLGIWQPRYFIRDLYISQALQRLFVSCNLGEVRELLWMLP